MVNGWNRKDVSCNQYIGSLGPGTVIRHSSVDNGESNGTNLVSKSINNSFFAIFRNDEAIFSKNSHICMGVKLNRTRGSNSSIVRNSSLWICDSYPSSHPVQIFSSLLLPCVSSRKKIGSAGVTGGGIPVKNH